MKFHFVRALFAVILLGLAKAASPAQVMYSVPGPWVDDAATPFHLESLTGGYTVVTMAYGACQRVCSTTVRRIEQLHELARLRHVSLNFVVFGLDPAEDKPSDWAAFRASRHLSFANLQFLSGAPAATRRMANWLGIGVWRYGEHTMHDFRIVLVSPTGTVVRSISHFDDDVELLLP